MDSSLTKSSASSSGSQYDFLVKVKFIGDSNVGKSSIVLRFCDDSFSQDMMPTIGVDYKSKVFTI